MLLVTVIKLIIAARLKHLILAFIKKSNGTYQIVGVMVGSVSGKDRLVPIDKLR